MTLTAVALRTNQTVKSVGHLKLCSSCISGSRRWGWKCHWLLMDTLTAWRHRSEVGFSPVSLFFLCHQIEVHSLHKMQVKFVSAGWSPKDFAFFFGATALIRPSDSLLLASIYAKLTCFVIKVKLLHADFCRRTPVSILDYSEVWSQPLWCKNYFLSNSFLEDKGFAFLRQYFVV